MEPKMTDREAFEKRAEAIGLDVRVADTRIRKEDGSYHVGYVMNDTQGHWLTWKAACKYKDEQQKSVSVQQDNALI